MTKIVIDSITGLTKTQAQKMGYGFLPLSVIDGTKKYLDGIDIDTKWLQERQESGAILKTSQPATQVIEDIVAPLIKKNKDILIITVSSKLSGTYSNVCQVSKKYPNIKVFDSLQAGHATVVMAQLAEKMLKKDSIDEVIKKLENIRNFIFTYVVPFDVNYMARSGRVSPAVAKFAKMIGIIPLMHVDKDGTVQKFDKCRSTRKAIQKIYKHAKDMMEQVEEIAILEYGQSQEEKEQLQSMIEEQFGVKAIFKKVPTSVAVHIGPKSFGITVSKMK